MADPIYRSDVSMRVKHKRKFRRTITVIASLLALILAAGGLFLWEVMHLSHQPSRPSNGPTFVSKVAGPTVYNSEYFKFSDINKWVLDKHDSTYDEFTYQQYQGGVLAYSFTVYVNKTPVESDLAVTHVIPVTISDGNSFTVGAVSGDCNTAYAPTDLKRIKTVALSGTSMVCVPDSPQYTVIVGQSGGNYNLSLRRSDGQTANYVIIYNDLSVSPTAAPFISVLRSFQAQ